MLDETRILNLAKPSDPCRQLMTIPGGTVAQSIGGGGIAGNPGSDGSADNPAVEAANSAEAIGNLRDLYGSSKVPFTATAAVAIGATGGRAIMPAMSLRCRVWPRNFQRKSTGVSSVQRALTQ